MTIEEVLMLHGSCLYLPNNRFVEKSTSSAGRGWTLLIIQYHAYELSPSLTYRQAHRTQESEGPRHERSVARDYSVRRDSIPHSTNTAKAFLLTTIPPRLRSGINSDETQHMLTYCLLSLRAKAFSLKWQAPEADSTIHQMKDLFERSE